MKMKALLRKIFFITLPSIFVFLIILEISLWIGGYLYMRCRNSQIYSKDAVSDPGTFNILCLGDSYTYGLGAAFEYSYPRRLETMLNDSGAGKKFSVHNLGSPGGNSYRILKIFEEGINKYSPDMAIVMVGKNNDWNLEGMQRFSRFPIIKDMKLDIHSSRIYKLWEILIRNLAKNARPPTTNKDASLNEKPLARISDPEWQEHAKKIEAYKETGRADLEVEQLKKMLDKYPESYDLNLKLAVATRGAGDYDLALQYAKKALERAPSTPRHNAHIHLELEYIYNAKKQWAPARQEIDYIVRYLPHIQSAYPELKSICNEGSGLDFNKELAAVRKTVKAIHGKQGTQILDELVYLDKNEKERFKIFASDLSELIRVARKNDINLVLMTYPTSEPTLNTTIRKLAFKYNTSLIDNESNFARMPNRKEFFNLDDHCNADGYKLIATSIYYKLSENGTLK